MYTGTEMHTETEMHTGMETHTETEMYPGMEMHTETAMYTRCTIFFNDAGVAAAEFWGEKKEHSTEIWSWIAGVRVQSDN